MLSAALKVLFAAMSSTPAYGSLGLPSVPPVDRATAHSAQKSVFRTHLTSDNSAYNAATQVLRGIRNPAQLARFWTGPPSFMVWNAPGTAPLNNAAVSVHAALINMSTLQNLGATYTLAGGAQSTPCFDIANNLRPNDLRVTGGVFREWPVFFFLPAREPFLV